MRRIVVSTLLAGALSVPAFADPLLIAPDAGAASQSVGLSADQGTARPRYAAASGANLGGGFIEFLFGGARGAQPSDQPALPQTAMGTPAGDGHPPIDPQFEPQVVAYQGDEQPGTIIVDTPHKFLFLVEADGKAMRYGIGVGRPGFTWSGNKTITAKREWPDWRPPDDMLKRRPDLPRYMAGGPENPLGARAMYLGSTLYRIHGSNEPWTIGSNVSSGCIRMRNEDVSDLYDRVKVGTKVVVM
jgi:lipoprotein-anchoring transpeptidase ErfK/SrfK